MIITDIIIPFDIEQKLLWKHQVNAYEVEEVLIAGLSFDFAKKAECKAKTFTQRVVKPKPEDL